ncbi:hypothetical protein AHiyo8_01220 [Arthrobacter sp. Hiyo8]|nr:hypothetical protein AHiyo8_01220 [Arthrobacter sp. Hiyo8]
MSIAAEIMPLTDLAVGDKVVLKRNLDHPAHMKQLACDARNGSGTMFVRDPDVEEQLCTTTIIERRYIPAIPGVGLWAAARRRPSYACPTVSGTTAPLACRTGPELR